MRVGLKKKNQREKLREENEPVVHTEREREIGKDRAQRQRRRLRSLSIGPI